MHNWVFQSGLKRPCRILTVGLWLGFSVRSGWEGPVMSRVAVSWRERRRLQTGDWEQTPRRCLLRWSVNRIRFLCLWLPDHCTSYYNQCSLLLVVTSSLASNSFASFYRIYGPDRFIFVIRFRTAQQRKVVVCNWRVGTWRGQMSSGCDVFKRWVHVSSWQCSGEQLNTQWQAARLIAPRWYWGSSSSLDSSRSSLGAECQQLHLRPTPGEPKQRGRTVWGEAQLSVKVWSKHYSVFQTLCSKHESYTVTPEISDPGCLGRQVDTTPTLQTEAGS